MTDRIHQRRPAETAGAGATLAGLILAIASHNTLAAILAGVGLIPAAVTTFLEAGGLNGIRRLIRDGRPRS